MSWYVRITRYASVHMVYAQERPNSCGMASVLMINFKVKKAAMMAGIGAAAAVSSVPIIGSTVGATMARAALDYAVKSEPYVYQHYTAVTGTPYDGSEGSQPGPRAQVLTNMGCGQWRKRDLASTSDLPAAIRAGLAGGAPVMIGVDWDGGGAHAMVVDGAHGDNLLICDPWDGELRVVSAPDGSPLRYIPGSVWSFSVGGTRYGGTDTPYARGSAGTGRPYVVERI
jgi:hypothetical protein